ncbi:glycosylase [Paenibacillus sp. 481]|uniref:glycosylase n=1 Tax=Paenibacillus sp. 481 TaxID=2835869 RepID=UPI001E2FD5AE|nr:glycosylase [Paenibacillus sp. 481]UHA75428.1 glycosylase [Paenibacillus sp. 481]
MYKWIKKGLVFNPSMIENRPLWLDQFAQAPNIVVFDKFVRVYFSCRPKPDENGQYVSYSAFVDLNRENLLEVINMASNPCLPLGNVGTFDEFGIYPFSAIREGNELLAYYGGWTRCESVPFNVAIGFAKSTDGGCTFKKVGEGPVLSYSPGEPFVISSPKIRKFNNVYYLSYIAGRKWFLDNGKPEIIYKIRMATSHDGLTWEKLNKDIISDKLGEDEAQASPDIIFRNNKYHMFFCYRKAVDFRRNKDNSYRIGYAYSDDLINWIRDDSKVGIDTSNDGWDSEMIAYPNVFELDGKIYMFYLGNEVGKFGFGLAELEGDLT